jgi:hypothetical protein
LINYAPGNFFFEEILESKRSEFVKNLRIKSVEILEDVGRYNTAVAENLVASSSDKILGTLDDTLKLKSSKILNQIGNIVENINHYIKTQDSKNESFNNLSLETIFKILAIYQACEPAFYALLLKSTEGKFDEYIDFA